MKKHPVHIPTILTINRYTPRSLWLQTSFFWEVCEPKIYYWLHSKTKAPAAVKLLDQAYQIQLLKTKNDEILKCKISLFAFSCTPTKNFEPHPHALSLLA